MSRNAYLAGGCLFKRTFVRLQELSPGLDVAKKEKLSVDHFDAVHNFLFLIIFFVGVDFLKQDFLTSWVR
jgi:hypothetical protein